MLLPVANDERVLFTHAAPSKGVSDVSSPAEGTEVEGEVLMLRDAICSGRILRLRGTKIVCRPLLIKSALDGNFEFIIIWYIILAVKR